MLFSSFSSTQTSVTTPPLKLIKCLNFSEQKIVGCIPVLLPSILSFIFILHLILYFLTFLLYVNYRPRILFLVREKRATLNWLTENCHNWNMSLFIVRKEDDFWNEDCIVQPDKDNQAHAAPTLWVNHEVNSSSHWTQTGNNLSRPKHKRLF